MLDLSLMKVGDVAKILLLDDHDEIDPERIRNDYNGIVDDVEELERTPEAIRAQVSFSEVASDESSCFALGEIQASTTLQPGDNDAYRSGMVVTFDEIDGLHSVILVGDHSGSGNSDESHEGYFGGTMIIVPLARRDEELAAAMSENSKDELFDMAARLSGIIQGLHGHTKSEITASPLWRGICELNRAVAGIAE